MLLFSNLLKEQHKRIFEELAYVLESFCIPYELMDSKDIWIRDFMPLLLDDGSQVSYIYKPSYLENAPHLRTEIAPLKNHLDLILDGGNFIRRKNIAILCNKVIDENRKIGKNEAQIIFEIKSKCKVDSIIFIPRLAYDRYGHSDSMVRFLSDDELLLNDFSMESDSFKESLQESLKGFKTQNLHYSKEFLDKYKWGAYLNYLEFSECVLVPTYKIQEDESILEQFKNIFKNKEIIPIYFLPIIKKGGALHCVSAIV